MILELHTYNAYVFSFEVKEFKHLNPLVERGEATGQYHHYFCYVPTKSIIREFQDIIPDSVKEDREGLEIDQAWDMLKSPTKQFHLYNRGILIVAESIKHDNRTNRVKLVVDLDANQGIIDGTKTLDMIVKFYNDLSENELKKLPNQYVQFEVITGLEQNIDLLELRYSRNHLA